MPDRAMAAIFLTSAWWLAATRTARRSQPSEVTCRGQVGIGKRSALGRARFVLFDDAGRDAPAVADLDVVRFRPGPDVGAVLTRGGGMCRPALSAPSDPLTSRCVLVHPYSPGRSSSACLPALAGRRPRLQPSAELADKRVLDQECHTEIRRA